MAKIILFMFLFYNVSARWTVNTHKFTLFVYCNFLVSLSTTVCSENINKQNVNDETLTDYSFLSRYHCTKSKNYLKRRYRIRHWIPMLVGTPCRTLQTSKEIIKCRLDNFRWVLYNNSYPGRVHNFFCIDNH